MTASRHERCCPPTEPCPECLAYYASLAEFFGTVHASDIHPYGHGAVYDFFQEDFPDPTGGPDLAWFLMLQHGQIDLHQTGQGGRPVASCDPTWRP